jgi:8-oxo-dGTP pyrophosphatase MutT (NUDIX family)
VQATGAPQDWQGWADLVRLALAPSQQPFTHDELWLVRDLDGHVFRSLTPPPDATPRNGAVLALFYPDQADLRLLLTVRSERMTNHRGEVSLPGGGVDPEDQNIHATALRECYEELGIRPETISIWGSLESIYITPSNYRITPLVGFSAVPPLIQSNPAEVSAVLTISLEHLIDPATVITEPWNLRGYDVLVPFFLVDGFKVWGATALILSELVARIRRVLAAQTPQNKEAI